MPNYTVEVAITDKHFAVESTTNPRVIEVAVQLPLRTITVEVVSSIPGPQGAKGDKGDKGDDGAAGAQGIQGVKGDKGDDGDDGAQGIQGVKGDKGDDGAQGIQGVTGATGATGPQGIPGIPARQPKFSVYLKNNETLTADPFSGTGMNFTNNIITIPANTISPNDNIVMKLYLEKTITTSGSNVVRLSIGTSPTQNDRQNPAVAANLVNINIPSSVGQFWMTRYNIRSTSNNFSGLSGGYSDVGVNSNSNTILGFDFANTLYLIPYIQYGSATFIVREMQLEIW